MELEVTEQLGHLLDHLEQVGGGGLPPRVVALVTDVDGHALAALNKRGNHHLEFVLRLVNLLLQTDILRIV